MTGAPFLRDLDDVCATRRWMIGEFSQAQPHAAGAPFSAHHIVEPYDHPIVNDIYALPIRR